MNDSISAINFVLIAAILMCVRSLDVQDLPLSPRQVNTKYGAIRGVMMSFKPLSSSSQLTLHPIEAFLGVPYEAPPIKSLRFMPPVTPSFWRGVRLANRFGAVCPQRLPDVSNATEALKKMSVSRFEHIRRVVSFIK